MAIDLDHQGLPGREVPAESSLPDTRLLGNCKAAVHSFTERLRMQLADSNVQVIELVPPGVRTKLYGQGNDERAMPLDEFQVRHVV